MPRRRHTPDQIIRKLAEGQKLLLLTPNRRRAAVEALRARFGVSQRRACRVVGQHRSTQRLPSPVPGEDEVWLREWLRAFATARPRWGWRRAAKQPRRDGHRVNDKRVQRLWRAEGLKVPYRKRKKPHRGIGVNVGTFCQAAPNALWAMDFQFDTTADHRALKLLNIVDEFTREAVAIVVDRSIDADKVVATLDAIAFTRGAPAFVRFDIHSVSASEMRVLASWRDEDRGGRRPSVVTADRSKPSGLLAC